MQITFGHSHKPRQYGENPPKPGQQHIVEYADGTRDITVGLGDGLYGTYGEGQTPVRIGARDRAIMSIDMGLAFALDRFSKGQFRQGFQILLAAAQPFFQTQPAET